MSHASVTLSHTYVRPPSCASDTTPLSRHPLLTCRPCRVASSSLRVALATACSRTTLFVRSTRGACWFISFLFSFSFADSLSLTCTFSSHSFTTRGLCCIPPCNVSVTHRVAFVKPLVAPSSRVASPSSHLITPFSCVTLSPRSFSHVAVMQCACRAPSLQSPLCHGAHARGVCLGRAAH